MLVCFRAKYSTPRGIRYLSVRALDSKTAAAILKGKTPWRAGWCYEGLV